MKTNQTKLTIYLSDISAKEFLDFISSQYDQFSIKDSDSNWDVIVTPQSDLDYETLTDYDLDELPY